jgi:hypothetical protein
MYGCNNYESGWSFKSLSYFKPLRRVKMSVWAFIMLIIALGGLVVDLFFDSRVMETSTRLIMQDLLLLLFALGVLIRIRVKTLEGEKEKLAAASRMKTRAEKRAESEPWTKS